MAAGDDGRSKGDGGCGWRSWKRGFAAMGQRGTATFFFRAPSEIRLRGAGAVPFVRLDRRATEGLNII